MNISGGLHKFLCGLDIFADKNIYIDYLANDANSYTVTSDGEDINIRSYTDGGKLMEHYFTIATRQIYSKDSTNIHSFFSLLADNLKECSDNKNLPDIGRYAVCIDIKPVSNVIINNNDLNMARYCMKFKLIYYVN